MNTLSQIRLKYELSKKKVDINKKLTNSCFVRTLFWTYNSL